MHGFLFTGTVNFSCHNFSGKHGSSGLFVTLDWAFKLTTQHAHKYASTFDWRYLGASAAKELISFGNTWRNMLFLLRTFLMLNWFTPQNYDVHVNFLIPLPCLRSVRFTTWSSCMASNLRNIFSNNGQWLIVMEESCSMKTMTSDL